MYSGMLPHVRKFDLVVNA